MEVDDIVEGSDHLHEGQFGCPQEETLLGLAQDLQHYGHLPLVGFSLQDDSGE